ncbi:SH3 domain-containing protein [Nitrospina gracilis]|uniref:SH3 domain-containing protein n=1 Tax=Nitrospina gracilis TaxID=35801 RepID=UPI00352FF52E|nr:RNA-binding protein YhbY [Nitrospina gracilis Nb-211]
MESSIVLEKNHTVHLKEKGEVCNRLNKGTRVKVLQARGNWLQITWRNGKKKGWIEIPSELSGGRAAHA